MYYNHLGMSLIHNVLSNKDRKKLIKDCQPLLLDLNEEFPGKRFPGKQTKCNLHLHPDFLSPITDMIRIIVKETGLDLVVADMAWINWTNGSKKDIAWHRHPDVDYALVYYIKTPIPFFSNGTVFKDGLVRAPQNSMIIFPAHLLHTAPSSPFRFGRYTMAINLNIRNNFKR